MQRIKSRTLAAAGRLTLLVAALSAAPLGAVTSPAGVQTAPAVAVSIFDSSIDPSDPTWADNVTLRFAAETCGQVEVVPSVSAVQRQVYIHLGYSCGTATPQESRHQVALGRLDAGHWSFSIHDAARDQNLVGTFVVADRLATVLLLPSLATDASPVTVQVGALTDCPYFDWRLTGKVIEIDLGPDICTYPSLGFGPPSGAFFLDAPVGILSAGDYEVRVSAVLGYFGPPEPPQIHRARLRVWKADGCLPGDTSLCLQRGRFRVEGTWRDFDGHQGLAHAAPLPDAEQSGLLWFFGPDNSEITVKVLPGCSENGSWWVFASSSSTVEYDLTVTDTKTGVHRNYHNPLGEVPALVADTGSFPCS